MKKEEIYKDPFIAKLFAEGGEVPPSAQFANSILKKIKAETHQSTLVFTPLISKKAWLLITLAGVAMFVAVFFTSKTQTTPVSDFLGFSLRYDFSFLRQMAEKVTLSFQFGPVMKTSLLAMAVFIFIQMIVLEWRHRSIFK